MGGAGVQMFVNVNRPNSALHWGHFDLGHMVDFKRQVFDKFSCFNVAWVMPGLPMTKVSVVQTQLTTCPPVPQWPTVYSCDQQCFGVLLCWTESPLFTCLLQTCGDLFFCNLYNSECPMSYGYLQKYLFFILCSRCGLHRIFLFCNSFNPGLHTIGP